MKKITLLISIAFVLFACQSRNEENNTNVKTIVIDCDQKIEPFNYLDHVEDEFDVVFLEYDSSKIVSSIRNLKIVNDTIYFMDKVSQSIFRYDLNGKFISKLSARGHSNSEYVNIDMPYDCYNVKNGNIYIVDFFKMAILQYDRNNNFVKSISYKSDSVGRINANGFTINEDETINIISVTGSSGHHFFELDANGTIISQLLPTPESKMKTGATIGATTCIKTNNKLSLLYFPQVDTIYQIKDKIASPLFAVDFGKYKLPDSKKEIKDLSPKEQGNHVATMSVNLTENNMFIHFAKNLNEFYIANCTLDGKLIALYDNEDPMDGGYITEKYFVKMIPQISFESYFKKFKERHANNRSLEKVVSKLDSYDRYDDNPFLIIYKWRK